MTESERKEYERFNPFTKRHLNLTQQGILYHSDPALYAKLQAQAPQLDAEAERLKRTRTLQEFNQLDTAAKVKFLQSGGEVS